MAFLMQVYAPLDSLPDYERSYYVFVCTKYITKTSYLTFWKVIRTMIKVNNEIKSENNNNNTLSNDEKNNNNEAEVNENKEIEEEEEEEEKEISEEQAEDEDDSWGDDDEDDDDDNGDEDDNWGAEGADDWGIGESTSTKKKESSKTSTTTTTTTTGPSKGQEKSLEELIQERNKQLHEDQMKKKDLLKEQKLQQQQTQNQQQQQQQESINKDDSEPAGFTFENDKSNQYEEYYLYIDTEVLKKETTSKKSSKLHYVDDPAEGDEWSGETYEYVKDRIFSKFIKRISHNPNQVVRYSFKGEALYMSEAGKKLVSAFYPCQKCRSQKVFEFQVLSTIITQVYHVTSSDLDFSNIFIYTCPNHCHENTHNDVIYVEELVLLEKSI
ncbi:hypothetical protein PPL_08984 [Heterostelium album PN500]|uniref:Programmed cell death protein 2 C-terminal domain-containing protein n=1 Tax=Heterostelium pallidum (strain ATCC 26659 / Pp 5 / PN500) TaxID=670386 RepID=D3BKA3_HETP5|nr:hypothetical protein PPL_08984 [Heterostelium album PN500]EFA78333.1 hypothetical protein PPL_08984 [Heterostelium album PN500]|eukprot:XP_020430458.1 hypothetical protein PPL_08984 [Heterostelium album PN500]